MRGQDDRAPTAPKFFDHLPEFQTRLWIQSGCWFIEEEEVWIAHQSARNSQALSLAAREFTDTRVTLLVQFDNPDD
jgi:hypothetical protein